MQRNENIFSMGSQCMNYGELVRLWHTCRQMQEGNTYTLSEIDTEVLFVEPILRLAGWNPHNPGEIRRANRGKNNKKFDIEAYRNNADEYYLKLAIECKSISNKEYNGHNISDTNRGALIFREERWKQTRSGDGVGQLRRYCTFYKNFDEHRTVPILTNGISWTVFNNSSFLDSTRLHLPIEERDVLASAEISSHAEFERIIEHIRK